jgi:hypothetical protein
METSGKGQAAEAWGGGEEGAGAGVGGSELAGGQHEAAPQSGAPTPALQQDGVNGAAWWRSGEVTASGALERAAAARDPGAEGELQAGPAELLPPLAGAAAATRRRGSHLSRQPVGTECADAEGEACAASVEGFGQKEQ